LPTVGPDRERLQPVLIEWLAGIERCAGLAGCQLVGCGVGVPDEHAPCPSNALAEQREKFQALDVG
jgi:hypothetical protein